MVSTAVEVCNIALAWLGESRIVGLDGSDDKSIMCNLLYYPLLDKALRSTAWNFAAARQALASSADANYTSYAYMYRLPESPYCLKPLMLLDSSYAEVSKNLYPFQVEGRFLYADLSDAVLKYTKRVTEPTEFDSSFTLYFAAVMAKEIAFRLTNDIDLANRMEAKAAGFLSDARADNSEESYVEESNDLWVNAKDGWNP